MAGLRLRRACSSGVEMASVFSGSHAVALMLLDRAGMAALVARLHTAMHLDQED